MEPYTYVFCDWTLLDLAGRFFMFCVWGYSMGKSVIHSPNKTWTVTFLGVLFCVFIHTWMHFCDLPQPDAYDGGLYTESAASAGTDLITYGIKVFIFYLTASLMGYRAGRQKAKVEIAELNRVLATLKKLEADGIIKEDDGQVPRQDRKTPIFSLPVGLINHPFIKKLMRYGARKT